MLGPLGPSGPLEIFIYDAGRKEKEAEREEEKWVEIRKQMVCFHSRTSNFELLCELGRLLTQN